MFIVIANLLTDRRVAVRGLLFCVATLLVGNGVAEPAVYRYQVLETVAHDPQLFTQGLVKEGEWFYESSGLYGKSRLLRYRSTGENASNQATNGSKLPEKFFAEGLALFNNRLYLLTWREGKTFVYNKETLKQLKSFNYSGEGWGLTHDGTHFIMSDGSDTLSFRSPTTFEVEKTITVHSGNRTWSDLNELEYVDGIVWANQWRTSNLLGIDENSGEVKIIIDLTALHRQAAVSRAESVANGIAYDKERDALWITGKYWRYRYLIKPIAPETATH